MCEEAETRVVNDLVKVTDSVVEPGCEHRQPGRAHPLPLLLLLLTSHKVLHTGTRRGLYSPGEGVSLNPAVEGRGGWREDKVEAWRASQRRHLLGIWGRRAVTWGRKDLASSRIIVSSQTRTSPIDLSLHRGLMLVSPVLCGRNGLLLYLECWP